jgi:hypothetical protein
VSHEAADSRCAAAHHLHLHAIAAAAHAAAQSADASKTGRLPVRRVVLYKNGIGYFEHLGRVTGNQLVTIEFTSAQLNDVLKSLTTLDLGGGRIGGISYNSDAPLAQQLGALRLPLQGKASRTELFDALRGARLELQTPNGSISGRLLSVERRTRALDKHVVQADELVVITDGGMIRTVALDDAVGVKMVEADTNRQVARYLDLLGAARAPDTRRMLISTAGDGERSLFVSYVSEVPIWKTTYRIVLPSDAQKKPLLQGWAIVDNTVGEDWTDVELSLVAGAPQSFIHALSQPYYASRPVVPLPSGALTAPQTHQAALVTAGDGPGTLVGRVTDPSGAALPGATVEIDNDEESYEATADGDGRYRITGIKPGKYGVEASLAGFKSTELTDLNVGAGQSLELGIELRVGGVEETVALAAEPKMMTGTSVAGYIVPTPPLEGLPMLSPSPSFSQMAAAGAAAVATVATRELGDLFEYRLKDRITIQKNQSALVPIVQSEVTAEKVAIWNQARGSSRPLRALWLTNSSALTLDGGSFSVIESDAFAGEGIMEPLKPGARRLVSYAADLGVLVEAKSDRTPQRVSRIRVARGTMIQQSEERQRVTYTVRNEEATARVVIVEHPAQDGWKLTGGATPEESSADGWHRFRVTVEPKKTAVLTVDELQPKETRIEVRDAAANQQMALILNNQTLDPSARAALKAIEAKKAEISVLDGTQHTRRMEVGRIEKDQQRLRENMKALKGSAEEKQLVLRYTRQLDAHEDQLEALNTELGTLQVRRIALQEELDAMLTALSLDVVVAAQQ